eukprot:525776-Rhodomonas_salina.1
MGWHTLRHTEKFLVCTFHEMGTRKTSGTVPGVPGYPVGTRVPGILVPFPTALESPPQKDTESDLHCQSDSVLYVRWHAKLGQFPKTDGTCPKSVASACVSACGSCAVVSYHVPFYCRRRPRWRPGSQFPSTTPYRTCSNFPSTFCRACTGCGRTFAHATGLKMHVHSAQNRKIPLCKQNLAGIEILCSTTQMQE